MIRILRTLLYSLCLICPVCRRGRMFGSLFTMHARCPACGVVFERDVGERTGGMAITMVVTSTITVLGGGALALFTRVPVLPLILALSLFTVVFGLLFYRHARALWVGFLYLSGAMFED